MLQEKSLLITIYLLQRGLLVVKQEGSNFYSTYIEPFPAVLTSFVQSTYLYVFLKVTIHFSFKCSTSFYC